MRKMRHRTLCSETIIDDLVAIAHICILGFIYVGILVVLTFEGAMVETANGAAHDVTYFDLPVWPSRWFLPAALFVMAIIMALQATRNFSFLLTGKHPAGRPGEQTLETTKI
jgi:TRAP-type C4-dicarboxylate transport system permease small subunit